VTAKVVGSGALLAGSSSGQDAPNFARIISHVSDRYNSCHLRLDRIKKAEITATNYSAAKYTMLSGKHLRIPFDPSDGLSKSLAKPDSTVGAPRLVVFVSVTKIVFDKRKELDWLAPHRRETRFSNSLRVIRSAFPDRYAFHRESSKARSAALTGRRSSTAARQSSSANFNFCRFGRLRSSGNCASAMPANVPPI